MGESVFKKVWPSDSKAFVPSSEASGIPIVAQEEPQLGKVYEMYPTLHRHPRAIPQVPIPKDVMAATLGARPQASPPMPPVKPPLVATAAPDPEDEPQRISAERLAFLERVEALVGAESKINNLETENRVLVSMVARLQNDLEAMKALMKEKA